MDDSLLKEDANHRLWQEYEHTDDYKQGQIKAICAHHPLVEAKEKLGLESLITDFFVRGLRSNVNENERLKQRTVKDWVGEWKAMHRALFYFVYKASLIGELRQEDVRFGNPGDEELYTIPTRLDVPRQIQGLAYFLTQELVNTRNTIEEQCDFLAKVHYEFIRIHPFFDGNGRIARAITDQLALYYKLPPAVVGYPRHDPKRRVDYHKAIRSCADDKFCHGLSVWIKRYIEIQLDTLA